MENIEVQQGDYTISTDKSRLNVPVIHEFLTNSYWAKGIPLEIVQKAIDHSLCFGVYHGQDQVGFARIITDFATVAYIGDVFILEQFRGHGLSKWMMSTIKQHPELQGLRAWYLATRDAHGLYAQFGFAPLPDPSIFMAIRNPDVYTRRD